MLLNLYRQQYEHPESETEDIDMEILEEGHASEHATDSGPD